MRRTARRVECDSRAAFGGVVPSTGSWTGTRSPASRMLHGRRRHRSGFDSGVVDRIRARRAGTRILQAPRPVPPERTVRQIHGGWLVQAAASTKRPQRLAGCYPQEADRRRGGRCGIRLDGPAATSRRTPWVMARGRDGLGDRWRPAGPGRRGRDAAARAGGRAAGGACASDAFFPFADGIDAAGEAGVTMVVQPGGSVTTTPVIAAADRLGMAMVFTGERQFRH